MDINSFHWIQRSNNSKYFLGDLKAKLLKDAQTKSRSKQLWLSKNAQEVNKPFSVQTCFKSPSLPFSLSLGVLADLGARHGGNF